MILRGTSGTTAAWPACPAPAAVWEPGAASSAPAAASAAAAFTEAVASATPLGGRGSGGLPPPAKYCCCSCPLPTPPAAALPASAPGPAAAAGPASSVPAPTAAERSAVRKGAWYGASMRRSAESGSGTRGSASSWNTSGTHFDSTALPSRHGGSGMAACLKHSRMPADMRPTRGARDAAVPIQSWGSAASSLAYQLVLCGSTKWSLKFRSTSTSTPGQYRQASKEMRSSSCPCSRSSSSSRTPSSCQVHDKQQEKHMTARTPANTYCSLLTAARPSPAAAAKPGTNFPMLAECVAAVVVFLSASTSSRKLIKCFVR